MIELLNIIFQFTLFLFLTTFKISKKKIDFFDLCGLNIIILCNIFLVFSFLNINIYYLLGTIILFRLINFFQFDNKTYFLEFVFLRKKEILFLFFLFFIISFDVANDLKMGWDAQNFIFLKVLNFYNHESFSNLSAIPQPHYSHLGAYIWAFFWKSSFLKYEYIGRLFYVFIYLVSIFSIANLINKKEIKLIFVSFLILTSYQYSFFSGLQEILSFSFLCLFGKEFFLILDNKKKINLPLILLIFNMTIWFKNETMIFGLILVSFFIFIKEINLNAKIKLYIFVILLVAFRILTYKYIDSIVPENTNSSDYQFEKTLHYLYQPEILFRALKIITFYLFVNIARFPFLLFLIILMPVLFFMKRNMSNIFFFYIYIMQILFIYTAFTFNFYDIEFQTRVAMDRFIIATIGAHVLLPIKVLNDLYKLKK